MLTFAHMPAGTTATTRFADDDSKGSIQESGAVHFDDMARSSVFDEFDPTIRVVSFDVFETLLLRSCLHPEDVHEVAGMEIAAHLLTTVSPERWRRERVAAEREARSIDDSEEVTLEAIYHVLAPRVGLTSALVKDAIALECAAELRFLQPIGTTSIFLEKVRVSGRQIAFLSDMYLPAAFVRSSLERFGLFRDRDLLLVSSEIGRTKRTGRLFEYLTTRLDVRPHQVLHIGDNSRSDFLVPRRLGIGARIYRDQQPNVYERTSAKRQQTPILESLVSGVSRTVRLSRCFGISEQQTIWNTSASVAAPLLVGFVLWTLMEAHKRGVDRLFYLARDGQILERIARLLQPRFAPNVSVAYMYASRQAFYLPALDPTSGDFGTLFASMAVDRTLMEIADSLGVAVESLVQVARGVEDLRVGLDRIDEERARALAARVLQQPLGKTLISITNARLDAAEQYFKHVGLLSSKRPCIVDIGWKGKLQFFLSRILTRLSSPLDQSLIGLYFGLIRRPPPEVGESDVYIDDTRALSADLLELFCAADHGTTRAYVASGPGDSNILLASDTDDAAIAWGVRLQQEAILAYAARMIDVLPRATLSLADLVTALRHHGSRAFIDFRRMPSQAEAQVYGSFRHASDASHSTFVDIGPRLPPLDVLRELFPSNREHKKSAWPEATLMRSIGSSRLAPFATALLQGRDRVGFVLRGQRR